MKIKRPDSAIQEGDLTPMIDMTFQLIAFFMVLINFSQNDQDQRIQLPSSVLAKPPDAPLETPIFLNLTADGGVIIAGQDPVGIANIKPYLLREAETARLEGRSPEEVTVIIRATKDAPAGKVQELIKACQENRFVKFALRAKEEVGH